jgi:lambda family phage portal protein
MGMITNIQDWMRGGSPRLPVPSSDMIGENGAKADFTSGADNRGQRLAWARYSAPWSLGSPYIAAQGGFINRERNLASTVATDFSTSNTTIATLIENLATHNVGAGLNLSSKIDGDAVGVTAEEARALSSNIEKAWRLWANNPIECDLSGRHTLHDIARAAFMSYLRTGETVAALEWKRMRGAYTRTKLQLLDPRQIDQLRTKTGENGASTMQGVTFDRDGRVIAYNLIPITLGQLTVTNASTPVPAFTSWGRPKVIHLFDLIVAGQVRGLSPLVAALTPSQEKSTLGEFTLDAALLQTQYALTIESDLPSSAAMNGLRVNSDGFQDGLGAQGYDQLAQRVEFYKESKISAQPGVINHLSPGDKLKMNRAETPNSTFQPFDKSLTRAASKAAGSSYEDVSGDYSDTSFSASRLAGETPYRINVRRRASITERLYRTVFACWLEEALESGLIELPPKAVPFYAARDAYCNAKWLGLGRINPDPLKAAQAEVLEIENGLSTLTDSLAQRGLDFEETIETRKAEKAMLKAAGLSAPKTKSLIVSPDDAGQDDPPPSKRNQP